MNLTFKPFLFVLAVSLSLFSCSKEDDSTKSEEQAVANSSITTAGVISGTIENYTPGVIDILKCYGGTKDNEDIIIGTSTISTTGKFSMNLVMPVLQKIGKENGLEISDTTAMVGSIGERDQVLYGDRNNNYVGNLRKCNYTDGSQKKVGMSYLRFFYSDRTITIKGTYTDDYDPYSNIIYNVILKKGWTEVLIKAIKITNGSIETQSCTNDRVSDLKWRYFKHGSSSISSKISNVSQLKQGRLF